MILVISSHITNRFEYVLDFIKDCYPELNFQIANSIDDIDMKDEDIVIEYNPSQTVKKSISF